MYDVEGNRYLDYFGGVLTTMIGHSNPDVVAAVQAQAAKVMHTSTLYLSEPMIELAEEIAAAVGHPRRPGVLHHLGHRGQRHRPVARDLVPQVQPGAGDAQQLPRAHRSPPRPSPSHASWSSTSISGLSVNFVQGGYRLRSPFRDLDDETYTKACVADLEQLIDMTSAGDIACLIAEPIQGVGGFATPPDGFFGAMGKVLSNHGILFVSDEVQTGWGRTGEHFWGYQAHGIVPDMLTFAKGVGNGITLAGIVARAEIMDTIDVLSFSTFGGNPLSAAGGLATLRYVLDHDLQGNAHRMGAAPARRAGARRRPRPTGSPSCAARASCRPSRPCIPAASSPTPARAAQLLEGAKDRGLLVGKGGLYGNVIRITPMLNVTEAEIDEGVAALVDTIRSID